MRDWSLAVALVLTGCATHRSPVTSHPAPLAVPFIAQHPNYCGPAALAMVANYYGQTVTQDEIAQEIYLPGIRGTLTAELADYARRFQLWTRQYQGSLADLHEKLNAGVPLIVLGRFGEQYHYFVVLQVDGEVVAHSDTRPHFRLRLEDFQRHWERANRWTLLICPPDRAQWKLSMDEYNDLGVFLEKLNRLDEAAVHYRLAQSHFNLGNILLKQRRLDDAAAAFTRAIVANPENADALNNLAWVYHELGQNLDAAVTLCQRAITLRPTQRAYYLDTLGCVFLKQGKHSEAAATFAEALAATTDRQAVLRATIQKHLQEAGNH